MAPTWSAEHVGPRPVRRAEDTDNDAFGLPLGALRTALAIGAEAAGLPGALVRTLSPRRTQRDLGSVALRAAHDHQQADHRRRAGSPPQDWPLERLQAIGKATGTTLNDVVLAMCSGAMRTYLDELGALPDTSLVAMVPVGLKAKNAQSASASGGNAVGAVMAGSAPSCPTRPTGCRPCTTRW